MGTVWFQKRIFIYNGNQMQIWGEWGDMKEDNQMELNHLISEFKTL